MLFPKRLNNGTSFIVSLNPFKPKLIAFALLCLKIARPILDGLLHWSTCSGHAAVDCLPTTPALSPRRLVIEAMCKLCVNTSNADLLIVTQPFSKVCVVLGTPRTSSVLHSIVMSPVLDTRHFSSKL